MTEDNSIAQLGSISLRTDAEFCIIKYIDVPARPRFFELCNLRKTLLGTHFKLIYPTDAHFIVPNSSLCSIYTLIVFGVIFMIRTGLHYVGALLELLFGRVRLHFPQAVTRSSLANSSVIQELVTINAEKSIRRSKSHIMRIMVTTAAS
ncbi:hypothetical protein IF1G_09965 [Cordyceps javanica]|uniref:Uncharacterized protein n=1 Tax=Cordyceps javanica TaxID=43265 RepID=A0A545UPT0_9HYPO|nr:hypothetical protein IF1G_09965 [Cordyceps javanica]